MLSKVAKGCAKELVDTYGGDNVTLSELRFFVTCVLGFAGFFRIEELLAIQLKEVSIFDSHMEIFSPECKTAQHRKGNRVLVARTRTNYCPVNLVEDYLRWKKKIDKSAHPGSYTEAV